MASSAQKRSRLTLHLDPDLHLRIKIASVQARLSMREYVEQMLREHVPSLPQQAQPQRRPIASDVLERLARTRQEISGGRVLSDSTEIIRRMRDGAASATDP
jgi:hypothetical protein